jgi:hypothetical protein
MAPAAALQTGKSNTTVFQTRLFLGLFNSAMKRKQNCRGFRALNYKYRVVYHVGLDSSNKGIVGWNPI